MKRRFSLQCLGFLGLVFSFTCIGIWAKNFNSPLLLLSGLGLYLGIACVDSLAKDGEVLKFKNLPDLTFKFIGLIEDVFVFEHTKSNGSKVFYASLDVQGKINPGDVIRKSGKDFFKL